MVRKKSQKKLVVKGKRRSAPEISIWVRRSFSIGIIILMLVLLFMGIFKGFQWAERKLLSNNPRFEIQQLIIECNGKLTEDFIREMSQLHEGQNLFAMSIQEVESKLLEVSRIESVYIERDLPSTLILRVKERHPVARLMGESSLKYPFLVDRFGVILPFQRSLSGLPLIRGLSEDVRPGKRLSHRDVEFSLQTIALIASTSNLNQYIQLNEINIRHSDYIELTLQGGVEVRLPRFSLQPKLYKLATVIKIAEGQGRRVKWVDLTVDSVKVPVRYF
jgi:cell division protein FtsQ